MIAHQIIQIWRLTIKLTLINFGKLPLKCLILTMIYTHSWKRISNYQLKLQTTRFLLSSFYYLRVRFENNSHTEMLRLTLRLGFQKRHRRSFNFGINSGLFLWCKSMSCRDDFLLFHRRPLWLAASSSWWNTYLSS